jgi:hypothetical protein
LGNLHADEKNCGYPADGQHECVCEQPKADAQHDPQGLKSPLDWTQVPVAAVVPLLAPSMPISSLPDPDPDRGAPVALQFPLLI